MDFLNYNSVETLPGYEARAAFTVNSATVFREDVDIVPTIVDDTLSYIPWGGDNLMPFDLLALVEKDETLATCQCFNAEVCYGSGLQYCTTETTAKVKNDVEDLQLLDENYIKQMKRDLTPLTFQTSILCQRIGIAKDGFYSSMREGHKYDASNFEYLDEIFKSVEIKGYEFSVPRFFLAVDERRSLKNLLLNFICK